MLSMAGCVDARIASPVALAPIRILHMTDSSSQPSACAACGTSLADTPFVKDKKGRGICKPCVAKLKAKKEAKARAEAEAKANEQVGFKNVQLRAIVKSSS